MGWKSLFTPFAWVKFSVPILICVIVMLFVPQWIIICMCTILAGFFKKWYQNPGYWASVVLINLFIVTPLALQWAFDISSLQVLLDFYNIIQPATPRPPQIPVFSVSLEGSLSITPNLDLIYVWTFFSGVVVVSWLLIKWRRVLRPTVIMLAFIVYTIYGVLMGLGWFSWIVHFFSVGNVDLSSVLFNWDAFIPFYHLIFNFIPLIIVYVGIVYLLEKLEVYV